MILPSHSRYMAPPKACVPLVADQACPILYRFALCVHITKEIASAQKYSKVRKPLPPRMRMVVLLEVEIVDRKAREILDHDQHVDQRAIRGEGPDAGINLAHRPETGRHPVA